MIIQNNLQIDHRKKGLWVTWCLSLPVSQSKSPYNVQIFDSKKIFQFFSHFFPVELEVMGSNVLILVKYDKVCLVGGGVGGGGGGLVVDCWGVVVRCYAR